MVLYEHGLAPVRDRGRNPERPAPPPFSHQDRRRRRPPWRHASTPASRAREAARGRGATLHRVVHQPRRNPGSFSVDQRHRDWTIHIPGWPPFVRSLISTVGDPEAPEIVEVIPGLDVEAFNDEIRREMDAGADFAVALETARER